MSSAVPIIRNPSSSSNSSHSGSSSTSSSIPSVFPFPTRNHPQPSTSSSMLSPPQKTTPIPLPDRRTSNSGVGSYGNSLARSLRMGGGSYMGSYLGGMGVNSFEERMRMGSWKGRFLGQEAGQPWSSSIDAHDFSMAAMSTSIESNGGSMKMARNEADYCQNYNCCGLELSSMHDLLEHYEDVHVIILPSPQTNPTGGTASHDVDSMDLDSEPASSSSSSSSNNSNSNSPPLKKRQPIPASAPLQLSDVLAPPTNSAFETTVFAGGVGAAAAGRKKTKQALAGRAAFVNAGQGGMAPTSEWNSPVGSKAPSTVWEGEFKFSNSPSTPGVLPSVNKNRSIPPPTPSSCIPPTLLFPSSANPSANATDAATILALAQQAASNSASPSSAHSTPGAGPSTLHQHPTTIPALSLAHPGGVPPPPGSGQKIFKCPTPGCQKSYKQQNGLKYHLKVGQCNFEVRDAVENGLSEAEAEEKSRPFVCQVGGGCTKRYRQMNGLRYHYLNSGAHGAIGLALVAQGKHGHPKGLPGGGMAPGGGENGFTATTAMGGVTTSVGGGAGSGGAGAGVSAMGGISLGGGNGALAQLGGRPGAWEQAGGGANGDEVLFTVVEDDDDVDMEME